MRAFPNDGPEPESDDHGAQGLWSRREFNYPERAARGSPGPQSLIERVAARVGFASFERVFVAMTAAVVLAGCAIIFHAAFDNPTPAGQAAIEPTIIVAKREKPVDDQAPAASAPEPPAAPSAANAPQTPNVASLAPTVSMLSQTPMRESAREALARAAPAEPAGEAAAPEVAPPEQAMGYADATKTAEASEPVAADGAGRPANCFVKVGGRVLNKGACKVSHRGAAVTLAYGGSTVTIAPHRGREWMLSIGGRNVGAVYKSGGACWGSRNRTWICERGA